MRITHVKLCLFRGIEEAAREEDAYCVYFILCEVNFWGRKHGRGWGERSGDNVEFAPLDTINS